MLYFSKFIKNIFPVFLVLLNFHSTAQVGIGTFNPKDDSILDMESSTKGFLIPRIALTNLSTLSPITSPTSGSEGLLVYNTNVSLGKGFYFWNGIDSWLPIGSNSKQGLKFYSYNLNPSASPNLNNIIINEQIDKCAQYTGALNITNEQFPTSVIKPSNDEGFAIKLTGYYTVKTAGEFHFAVTSDDGARLYIDGTLVLEKWWDSAGSTSTGSVNLAVGKHKIEFWYYENKFSQMFNFQWGPNPDSLPTGPMHASQFTIE